MSGHQLQQPASSRRRLYLAHMETTWPCRTRLEPSASLGAACGRACRGDASLFSVADIPVYLLRLDISVDANETEM